MYESFFGMEHTPFVPDVPPEKLFESNAFRETLGRLAYGYRPLSTSGQGCCTGIRSAPPTIPRYSPGDPASHTYTLSSFPAGYPYACPLGPRFLFLNR